MSGKSIISNAYLEDIGDAIRQKKETDETYYPSQMGDAIRSIEGIVPSGTLEIDTEGTYDVTQYAEAIVDILNPVIKPWKNMVLENDYYNTGIPNLMEFLSIDQTDVLNGHTYFAEFLNNNYDQPNGKNFRIRFVIFKVFDGYDGEINAFIIRGETYNSNSFTHASNVGWGMTSGTIVNIYRLL